MVRKVGVAMVVVTLLASACSGEPALEDAEPVTAVEPTVETPLAETPETPTEVPTPAPEPAVATDEDLVAAAISAFEANPQPSDLIAWDHRDAIVLGNNVRVEICGWTGSTVFDSVRTVEYLVEPDDAGVLQSDFLFESTVPGECLNTELVASAFAATRDYDTYWGTVLDDPTTFDPVQAAEFKTAELIELNSETVARWNRDDIHWEGHSLDGALPDSAIVDTLWRRYRDDADDEVYELAVCRELDPQHGLYKGELLVNDFKDQVDGSQVIDRYRMRRDADRWVMSGVVSNSWADCTGFGDGWLDAVNEWQPEPTLWQVLDA